MGLPYAVGRVECVPNGLGQTRELEAASTPLPYVCALPLPRATVPALNASRAVGMALLGLPALRHRGEGL